PTVLLRADTDGLPVLEQTGLDYASTDTQPDADGAPVPVMHACGHDVHITALLGAAEALVGDEGWAGTLLAVFQPAEEVGAGAKAMLDDGLFERFGTPDVVLGQHVAPLPAGVIGLHPGAAFAASDTLRIVVHGEGGHGSRPETAVDPVVLAASLVMRLQTVVSREIGGGDVGVLTIGSIHGGTAPNIIPDRVELMVNMRSFDPTVRETMLAAIERITLAEAQASGAPRDPEIIHEEHFPLLWNDPAAAERTGAALHAALGAPVLDSGAVTGSEDVGEFAIAAGAPLVYWILGGGDPAPFRAAAEEITAAGGTPDPRELALRVLAELPSNHSPFFAPVPEPTLGLGVTALVAAAREWLATATPAASPR
ncbi:amidohydrolase, partial [Leucobacter sp. M11]|uniref:amidohydrolase n=1 Tax=Leucobacter sp. M11 TaxID=2993565 RepID=UPI002D7E4E02